MPKSQTHRPTPTGAPLTDREREILALVAAGETSAAISQRLAIAPNTVKAHLTSIYRKTGARNRVQAVRYYLDRHDTGTTVSGPTPTPLIERQIADLQARLDELAPIAAEIDQLRTALAALQRVERTP